MWEPFLWLALLVAALRWLRHPTAGAWASGNLPDVPDAPGDAEPLIRPRLDDNGLATYTMVVPSDVDAREYQSGDENRSADPRS
jgi:hypothetical protein